MEFNGKKVVRIKLSTLILVALLLAVYFVGISSAWFNSTGGDSTTGTVVNIDMALLDGNGDPLGPTTINYTGAGTVGYVVRVKSLATSSINAIIRIMIVGVWSGGLPYNYGGSDTFTYNFLTGTWVESGDGIGYDYCYYKIALEPDHTADFLTSITFPTLPSQYEGESVSFTVYAEGLQANSAAVTKWRGEGAPEEAIWNPLGV
ncbi:MAG: hypothetical protein AB7S44_01950 [Spirochaetales bacterium]